jgi:hypothetical protein
MDETLIKQSYCYHSSYSQNDIDKCVQLLKQATEMSARLNQQWWIDFVWLFASYIPTIVAANIFAYWLFKEKATNSSIFFSIIALILVEAIHQRSIISAVLFLAVSVADPTYLITGVVLILILCYISKKSYINRYNILQKIPLSLIILFVFILLSISIVSLQYCNFRLPPM